MDEFKDISSPLEFAVRSLNSSRERCDEEFIACVDELIGNELPKRSVTEYMRIMAEHNYDAGTLERENIYVRLVTLATECGVKIDDAVNRRRRAIISPLMGCIMAVRSFVRKHHLSEKAEVGRKSAIIAGALVNGENITFPVVDSLLEAMDDIFNTDAVMKIVHAAVDMEWISRFVADNCVYKEIKSVIAMYAERAAAYTEIARIESFSLPSIDEKCVLAATLLEMPACVTIPIVLTAAQIIIGDETFDDEIRGAAESTVSSLCAVIDAGFLFSVDDTSVSSSGEQLTEIVGDAKHHPARDSDEWVEVCHALGDAILSENIEGNMFHALHETLLHRVAVKGMQPDALLATAIGMREAGCVSEEQETEFIALSAVMFNQSRLRVLTNEAFVTAAGGENGGAAMYIAKIIKDKCEKIRKALDDNDDDESGLKLAKSIEARLFRFMLLQKAKIDSEELSKFEDAGIEEEDSADFIGKMSHGLMGDNIRRAAIVSDIMADSSIVILCEAMLEGSDRDIAISTGGEMEIVGKAPAWIKGLERIKDEEERNEEWATAMKAAYDAISSMTEEDLQRILAEQNDFDDPLSIHRIRFSDIADIVRLNAELGVVDTPENAFETFRAANKGVSEDEFATLLMYMMESMYNMKPRYKPAEKKMLSVAYHDVKESEESDSIDEIAVNDDNDDEPQSPVVSSIIPESKRCDVTKTLKMFDDFDDGSDHSQPGDVEEEVPSEEQHQQEEPNQEDPEFSDISMGFSEYDDFYDIYN